MNYYPFHVGDYSAHTSHLGPLEDIAYRRLLDLYYLREGPISGSIEQIARLIRMTDSQSTVHDVLQEFFNVSDHLHGKAYQHKRCDVEISRMQERQNQARAAAARSVEARKQRIERTLERTLNERSTTAQRTLNDRLATNTNTNTNTKEEEKKVTKEKTQPLRGAAALPRSVPTTKPDDVDDGTWQDWTSLRKSKRAPITRTVIEAARIEADKAGMQLVEFLRVWCLRGSTGLQAAWLKDDEKGNRPSFALQDQANAQARWEEMTGRKWPKGKRGEVVDVEVATARIEQ